MKKITVVSLASLIFLLLCSAVAVMLKNILTDALVALIIGVAILVLSGVLAFAIRESVKVNIICIALSSVAMGLLIRAWYVNRGFDNSFAVMTVISLGAVLYLWLFFALSKIPFIHKSKTAYTVLCVLYAVLSGVFYFLVMLNTKTTFV